MKCVFNPQAILKTFGGLRTLIRKWLFNCQLLFPKNEYVHVDYFGSFSFFFPASDPLFLRLKPDMHTGCMEFVPRLLSLAPPHNGFAWSPFHEMTWSAGFVWQLYNQSHISMRFLVLMDIKIENVKKSNFSSGLTFKSIYFKLTTK